MITRRFGTALFLHRAQLRHAQIRHSQTRQSQIRHSLVFLAMVMGLAISGCDRTDHSTAGKTSHDSPSEQKPGATTQAATTPAAKASPSTSTLTADPTTTPSQSRITIADVSASSVTTKESVAECTQPQCSSATLKQLVFDAPFDWLNPLITQQLLGLSNPISENGKPTTKNLPAALKQFVKEGQASEAGGSMPYDMTLEARLIGVDARVIVIQVSGYYYTGGAHGSAVENYLVIDRTSHRSLALSDVMLPAKKPDQLYPLFYAQFRQWVAKEIPQQSLPEYEKTWPFKLSKNWFPTDKGIALAYGQYEVGPYVVGMPQFEVPFAQLNGLIRPEFLQPLQGEAIKTQ